jgi:putative restriction endonuclease
VRNPRAWAFITIDDDRQYAGNSGYEDEPRRLYRYDSHVGNHKNVAVGDIAILRTRDTVCGIARIEAVQHSKGTKEMRRCPRCGTTALRPRKTKRPRYRCDDGHVFANPKRERADVTLYEAHYGASYVNTPDAVSVARLKSAAPRPGDQASIEEVDIAKLAPSFLKSHPASAAIFAAFDKSGRIRAETSAHDDEFLEELLSGIRNNAFKDSLVVEMRSTMAAIKLRRGTEAFRDSMLERYDSTCVMTGCRAIDVLESTHIWPLSDLENDDPSNGLLLRSDVHTLFDLHLIGVEPGTLAIHLDPALLKDYASLNGARIRLHDRLRLRPEALKYRWKAFVERRRGGR